MSMKKNPIAEPQKVSVADVFRFAAEVLGPEKNYYVLALIYGVGISLLSLATPISVQMLINTVANTGLTLPLVVLSAALFGLLLASGLLNALRIHLMEVFGRRFFARQMSDMAVRAIYAQNPFFTDDGRAPLFNRFFDIIIIQKYLPLLLIGGFTVILQAAVGFLVVASYHPLFLAFISVVIAFIWFIWFALGGSATKSAVALSHKKHKAAAWLQGVGASNGFFKSDRHLVHALRGTNDAAAEYIEQHRHYFRRHFAQTVLFLILYAVASAALLGLGGWLVIQGQLSLGQLVAAELILSAAFFGVSQLGTYLNYFYEVLAAAEEISLFQGVDQEAYRGDDQPVAEGPAALRFKAIRGDAQGRAGTVSLDFEIEAGAHLMARAASHGVQRLFTDLIKRHEAPKSGLILFAGADIMSSEVHVLRQRIIVIDRPTIIEATIREYLSMCCASGDAEAMVTAIEAVDLETAVSELPDGLDTKLSVTGWPLSTVETMRLKLAAAILSKPRMLVLNQLFDMLPENDLRRALDALSADTSVVYFSNRSDPVGFEDFLLFGRNEQVRLRSLAELQAACSGGGRKKVAPEEREVAEPAPVIALKENR